MVPEAGFEPARLQQARDFKSLVSTCFTTRANLVADSLEGVRSCYALLRPRPLPRSYQLYPRLSFTASACRYGILSIDMMTKRCQESSYLLYSSLLSDGLFNYHILMGWGGRVRTFEMRGSKPRALPLGYSPRLVLVERLKLPTCSLRGSCSIN